MNILDNFSNVNPIWTVYPDMKLSSLFPMEHGLLVANVVFVIIK